MSRFKVAAGLVSGVLFGAGLAMSGMTDPNKILNFLDVTGRWDPSLLLVMAGAVPLSALAFHLGRRRERPLFDARFLLPTNTRLDGPLVLGSALFGLGWGLGGYCPGPAIASLSRPSEGLLGFLIAMGLGLLLRRPLARRFARGD